MPLLGRSHLWLSGADSSVVDGVIAGVLLRTLAGTAPGGVTVIGYDPGHLGGGLAGFTPLCRAGLLSIVGPGGLGGLLDDLVERIRQTHESPPALPDRPGARSELASPAAPATPDPPWLLAVLLADAATVAELTAAQAAQLDRVIRTGVACGVHLIVRGLPPIDHPAVCHVRLIDDADPPTRAGPSTGAVDPTGTGGSPVAVCDTTGDLLVRLDPPPPGERVTAVCRDIADRALAGLAPPRLVEAPVALPMCRTREGDGVAAR